MGGPVRRSAVARSFRQRRHSRTVVPPVLYTRAAFLAELDRLLLRVTQQYGAAHGLSARHIEYFVRFELRIPRHTARADEFFKHGIVVRQFQRHGPLGVERLLRHTAFRVHRSWMQPAVRRPKEGFFARLVARLRSAV